MMYNKVILQALLMLFCCVSLCYGTTLQVKVHGVDDDIHDNIMTTLHNLRDRYPKHLTTDNVKEIYGLSSKSIQQAMQPYGYFRAKISSEVEQTGANWLITYHIKPGPALRVTSMMVIVKGPGKHNMAIHRYLQHPSLHKGMVMNMQTYQTAKHTMFSIAEQHGYIRAKFTTAKIFIDRKAYTAHIKWVFHTGPIFYFGHIHFSKTPFAKEFIYRYVQFHYGDPYNPKALLDLDSALRSTGYFSQILVLPEISHDKSTKHNRHIPIDVKLTMQPSQEYTIGIGASSDADSWLRILLGVNRRYFSAYGHHFTAALEATSNDQSLQAKYTVPGRDPLHQEFNLSGAIYRLDYPKSESRAALVSANWLRHYGKWRYLFSINGLQERFENNNEPKSSSFLLYPSFEIKYTNANDLVDPDHGYMFRVLLQGTSKRLASKFDFFQAIGETKIILNPIPSDRIIFRTLGGVININEADLPKLPTSLQFYTGGSGSVRGYRYQDIGPGKFELIGSTELQHEVIKKWYIAGFYDAGDVTNGKFDFKRSYGVGIVRRTQIGPISIYAARPIDRIKANGQPDNSWHIVFTLGAMF